MSKTVLRSASVAIDENSDHQECDSVSTLGGDRRVAADAQIKRTRSEIEALLVDYAIKASELAMLADEHA